MRHMCCTAPYAPRPTPQVTIGSASPHEPINDAGVSLKFQSYTRVDKKPLCYQVYREAFLLNGARSFAVASTALKAGQTLSISLDHPNRRLLLFALCQIEILAQETNRQDGLRNNEVCRLRQSIQSEASIQVRPTASNSNQAY